MVLMIVPKLGSHYPPYAWSLIQSLYDHILNYSVRHLVDPSLFPDSPDGIFGGVKRCGHFENIVFNTFLDIKVSFNIDTMDSVEFSARDDFDFLWLPPFYFLCSANNHNPKFPRSDSHPREGKKLSIPTTYFFVFILCGYLMIISLI